jgi:hypothetical protein
MDYRVEHRESLFPELHKVWKANGFKKIGSWEEIFGKSEFRREMKNWKFYSYYTKELFSAWNYTGYAKKIAAAGGLKIRCAKRNTASNAELLNMMSALQIAWLVVGLR